MKKLALVILCFMMTLNSFAASMGKADLFQVFDEYQYSVTVDWDQKDEKKLESLTNDFYDNLGKVIAESGMNQNEVERLLSSRIKDTKALEAAKLKLSLLGPNPSKNDLIRFLKDEGKQMYSQGSSWNGQSALGIGLPVLIVAFLIYAALFGKTSKCVRYEKSPNLTCYHQQIPQCDYRGENCTFRDGPLVCEYLTQCAEYVEE